MRGRLQGVLLVLGVVAGAGLCSAPAASASCPAPNGDPYSTAVLADSPLAYYRLNEPSGTTLCDSSTSGLNGTYSSPGITYGLPGPLVSGTDSAVASDGSGGGIATEPSDVNINSSSFTLEGWFRSTGTTQDQALVDTGGSGGDVALATFSGATCAVGASGVASQLAFDNAGAANSNCWDTSTVGVNLWDGKWHYLAVVAVFDGGGIATVTAYVDGHTLGSQTSEELSQFVSPILLGEVSSQAGDFIHVFVGEASELALYTTALSSARIAAHYAARYLTPQNTAAPHISGSAVQGQTLSTDGGRWAHNPTGYAYQWEDCDAQGNNCSDSGGATAGTYTLKLGDVGHTIRVRVTATNPAGSVQSTSAATGPVAGTTPVPVLYKSVNLARASGHVLVKLPGRKRFRTITGLENVPMGTIVDTTNGKVTVYAAKNRAGKIATAQVYGGIFKLNQQAASGTVLTVFTLVAPQLTGCRKGKATVARVRVRPRHRAIWVRDPGGGFTTRGIYARATERGTTSVTYWLTQDSCAGTLMKVVRGSVTLHDLPHHHTLVCPAGHKFLAHPGKRG